MRIKFAADRPPLRRAPLIKPPALRGVSDLKRFASLRAGLRRKEKSTFGLFSHGWHLTFAAVHRGLLVHPSGVSPEYLLY